MFIVVAYIYQNTDMYKVRYSTYQKLGKFSCLCISLNSLYNCKCMKTEELAEIFFSNIMVGISIYLRRMEILFKAYWCHTVFQGFVRIKQSSNSLLSSFMCPRPPLQCIMQVIQILIVFFLLLTLLLDQNVVFFSRLWSRSYLQKQITKSAVCCGSVQWQTLQ